MWSRLSETRITDTKVGVQSKNASQLIKLHPNGDSRAEYKLILEKLNKNPDILVLTQLFSIIACLITLTVLNSSMNQEGQFD